MVSLLDGEIILFYVFSSGYLNTSIQLSNCQKKTLLYIMRNQMMKKILFTIKCFYQIPRSIKATKLSLKLLPNVYKSFLFYVGSGSV